MEKLFLKEKKEKLWIFISCTKELNSPPAASQQTMLQWTIIFSFHFYEKIQKKLSNMWNIQRISKMIDISLFLRLLFFRHVRSIPASIDAECECWMKVVHLITCEVPLSRNASEKNASLCVQVYTTTRCEQAHNGKSNQCCCLPASTNRQASSVKSTNEQSANHLRWNILWTENELTMREERKFTNKNKIVRNYSLISRCSRSKWIKEK